jgi:hypothetical protein
MPNTSWSPKKISGQSLYVHEYRIQSYQNPQCILKAKQNLLHL